MLAPLFFIVFLLSGCGEEALINVADSRKNASPVIFGEPQYSVRVGESYRFEPVANDLDDDKLLYSVSGKPRWAEFDPATGMLWGTPKEQDPGTYPDIIIKVTDGMDEDALGPFSITVVGANAVAPPPVEYNLDSEVFPIGSPPQVAAGESYADPLSGYQVLRITDVDNLNPPRSKKNPGKVLDGVLNEYAIPDIENADGSMLIVMATNSNFWYLYDVQSGAYIKELTKLSAAAEPRWDVSDPNILYYRKGAALYRYDVSGDQSVLLYDFRQDYPDMQSITSGTKGEASADGRYRPFIVRAGGPAADLDWIVFDFKTNSIVGSYVTATGSRPAFKAKYCVLSPSGNYVLVNSTQAPGGYRPYVYRRDFSGERRMGTRKGHFDFALDAAGREVFVAQDSDTDWITATYLEDLSEQNLLKLNFSSSTYVGLHLSGNNYDRPGWVLVSTYGPQTSRGEQPAIWSDGTHYMLEIKENGRHWRVAQTFTRFPQTNKKYYWLEAAATINRSGTRIYWGANHHDQRDKYVDLYQLTLPESWYRDLQEQQ
ncbi:MAG TPA: hypothetical protein ENJ43_06965 [Gammaproteobacteria bacterium]|nr:hypothetical protein [Gammaproteobacteria bacterium]